VGIADQPRLLDGYRVAPVAVVATGLLRRVRIGAAVRTQKVIGADCARAAGKRRPEGRAAGHGAGTSGMSIAVGRLRLSGDHDLERIGIRSRAGRWARGPIRGSFAIESITGVRVRRHVGRRLKRRRADGNAAGGARRGVRGWRFGPGVFPGPGSESVGEAEARSPTAAAGLRRGWRRPASDFQAHARRGRSVAIAFFTPETDRQVGVVGPAFPAFQTCVASPATPLGPVAVRDRCFPILTAVGRVRCRTFWIRARARPLALTQAGRFLRPLVAVVGNSASAISVRNLPHLGHRWRPNVRRVAFDAEAPGISPPSVDRRHRGEAAMRHGRGKTAVMR